MNESRPHILVKLKNVYGNELVYPVGEAAKMFTYLTGTQTLTPNHIAIIKDLGFAVVVDAPKQL